MNERNEHPCSTLIEALIEENRSFTKQSFPALLALRAENATPHCAEASLLDVRHLPSSAALPTRPHDLS